MERTSFDNSEELNAHIREESCPAVYLSFSTGKDSIAAYIALRNHFEQIIPTYFYLIPGLEFVEESLQYYEKVFGCRIHRLPHPSLYRWLNALAYQAPENCAIIEAARLEEFTYEDLAMYLIEDYGYPEEAWTAVGVRAVDSPVRMASIRRHGPLNYRTLSFFPVYDWKKDRLLEEIRKSGIKLPVDYHVFGRSFDGLDRRFMEPMKRYFPRDYKRVLEFFPLLEADIMRKKYAEK